MADELIDKRIAFLTANEGVEQVELTDPWGVVEAAGGTPVLIAPESETVQGVNHDEKADQFPVDAQAAHVSAEEFDGLVLPGGVMNPDTLRTVPGAVALVKAFTASGKPVAAICHGPWTLVEADVLGGKTLTSWPSLRTDIRNAGGSWTDAEVVTCTENGWTLVTSREPGDLPAFTAAILQNF
jgi:protease I